MRFIHCADIHLDSPLRGLERYEGAPVDDVRAAPRRAFEQLVEFAVAERVDFVVIAGDLYDGEWQDFSTGLYFVRQMQRLGESGIPVYVVRGNHDAVSRITRGLRLPKNVHLFDPGKPHCIVDEGLGIAVHGQSFARPDITQDLAASYPAAVPGKFNLGVLHTALTGRAGHLPYAPTSVDILRGKGYDYWALGHVHAREVVASDPWIVFPGNLQGRHIRERGAKGAELVTVTDGRIDLQSVPFDVLRWDEVELPVDVLPDTEALLDAAAHRLRTALEACDERALAVRLRITGRGVLHRALSESVDRICADLRSCALEVSGGRIWVEKIVVEAGPQIDLARLAQGDDPVALLLQEFARLRADPNALVAQGHDVLRELWDKLPSELSVDEQGQRIDSAAALGSLLHEAEGELLARLITGDPA